MNHGKDSSSSQQTSGRMPSLRGGYSDDQPYRAYPESPYDQPFRYGGPATGELFNDDLQPMPVAKRTSRARQKHYAPLSQSIIEDDDQIMPIPRVASGSHNYGSTATQRRTPSGSQYNSLPQHESEDEDDEVMVVASSSNLRAHGKAPEMRQVGRDDSRHSLLGSTALGSPRTEELYGSTAVGVNEHSESFMGSSATGSRSGNSRKRSDFKEELTWAFTRWEPYIIWAGAFLGLLSFGSQWAFWDGFVKASGDRYLSIVYFSTAILM